MPLYYFAGIIFSNEMVLLEPPDEGRNSERVVLDTVKIDAQTILGFPDHMRLEPPELLPLPVREPEFNFQCLIKLDIGIVGGDKKAAFRSIPDLTSRNWHAPPVYQQSKLS